MSKPKDSSQHPKKQAEAKARSLVPAAVQNAKDAARRLQEAGIVDAEGRRIRKDLRPDMRESQDRDFGG